MSATFNRVSGTSVLQITAGGEVATFVRAEYTDERLAKAHRDWRGEFEQTNPGRAVVEALRQLEHCRPERYEEFYDEMFFTCWCSKIYCQQARKYHLLALERQKAEQRRLMEIVDAGKALLELANSPDAPTWLADSLAQAPIGQPLAEWIADIETIVKPGVFFDNLEPEKPGRNRIACLDYGCRVTGHRRPADEATELGLVYDLARRVRCWTDSSCTDPLGADDVRIDPQAGSPHYDIVATLVMAALKGERNRSLESRMREASRIETLVRQFRRKYPNARYIGWYLDAAAFPYVKP